VGGDGSRAIISEADERRYCKMYPTAAGTSRRLSFTAAQPFASIFRPLTPSTVSV